MANSLHANYIYNGIDWTIITSLSLFTVLGLSVWVRSGRSQGRLLTWLYASGT